MITSISCTLTGVREACLFDGLPKTEAGALVGADVDAEALVELVYKVVEQGLVKVAAPQVPVPCQGQHLQMAPFEGHDRNLEKFICLHQ